MVELCSGEGNQAMVEEAVPDINRTYSSSVQDCAHALAMFVACLTFVSRNIRSLLHTYI